MSGVEGLRVLVLARAYPNPALPGQGLWTERLVHATAAFAEPVVVSAIPWSPPGASIPEWRNLRAIPDHAIVNGIPTWYPRVAGGLLRLTHALDARLALPSMRRVVGRLHAERAFNLIHAHFIFPDGVIAARLGQGLGIPVVTTEHAHWRPWLDGERNVRSQVLAALPGIRIVTAVSDATRRTIRDVAGDAVRTELLPNVVDEDAFGSAGSGARTPGRILFVGNVRRVKGLDLLVHALVDVIQSVPAAHVHVIGSSLSPSYRRDLDAVRRLASALGIGERITFLGHLDPPDVAREMRDAVVVAVPSRRESFSAVTIEALASGTPVVATRCGGPEELLDESTGTLVDVDDAEEMAAALSQILLGERRFDPGALRASVVPRFGTEAATARLRHIYEAAVT